MPQSGKNDLSKKNKKHQSGEEIGNTISNSGRSFSEISLQPTLCVKEVAGG